MRVRLEFTSGIPSREVETNGTVEELLFAEFGNRVNFENLGGRAVILTPQAPEEVPAIEETPTEVKPKRKAKVNAGEE